MHVAATRTGRKWTNSLIVSWWDAACVEAMICWLLLAMPLSVPCRESEACVRTSHLRIALRLLELPVAMLELIFQFMSGARLRDYFDGRGRYGFLRNKVHLDMRSVIYALCPVSSATRALILGTPVFYREYNDAYWYHHDAYYWSEGLRDPSRTRKPSRPAIIVGLRPALTDHRLSSLLRAFPTASVQLIDVRGTGISALGVIGILCACPMLRELDVGECAGLSMVELASLLRSVRPDALQVEQLEFIEFCGSGTGLTRVGYRQQLSFSRTSYNNHICRRYFAPPAGCDETEVSEDLDESVQLGRVGEDPSLRAAFTAVESSIGLRQHPRPFFTLGVHLCEHCHTSFAEYVPQDGRGDKSFDTRGEQLEFLRIYGRHTCQSCGKESFLCMNCASYEFHYCEFWRCEACFCTDCDGASFTAAWDAVIHGGSPADWLRLQTAGTVYLRVAECREGDECETPQDWRIVCKPTTSSECSLEKVLCKRCGRWLCYRCAYKGGRPCEVCKKDCCDLCNKTALCDDCCRWLCTKCGPVIECNRCFEGSIDGEMCPPWHCADCCQPTQDEQVSIADQTD